MTEKSDRTNENLVKPVVIPKKNIIKRLWSVTIFAVIIYLCAVFCIYVDSYNDYGITADCAIVFGNKVHLTGKPSDRLTARLDAAFELYKSGKVRKILVSGGIGTEGHDEAVVMADYLVQKGLNAELIIVDSYGYNTSKTSLNSVKLLGKSTSVIAVTQQFHVSRAKMSLRHAGFEEVYGYFPDYFELRDFYSAAREVPAWIKYWLVEK